MKKVRYRILVLDDKYIVEYRVNIMFLFIFDIGFWKNIVPDNAYGYQPNKYRTLTEAKQAMHKHINTNKRYTLVYERTILVDNSKQPNAKYEEAIC